jgi:hypothetical protein
VIQGYTPIVRADQYGYQVFQLLLSSGGDHSSVEAQLRSFCDGEPNVTFLAVVLGAWDFELTCETNGQEELQQLILRLREQLAQAIRQLQVVITFNHFVKYRFAV